MTKLYSTLRTDRETGWQLMIGGSPQSSQLD